MKYDKLVGELKEKDEKYNDPEFPPDRKALIGNGENADANKWLVCLFYWS